jgi:hypothetical protein
MGYPNMASTAVPTATFTCTQCGCIHNNKRSRRFCSHLSTGLQDADKRTKKKRKKDAMDFGRVFNDQCRQRGIAHNSNCR